MAVLNPAVFDPHQHARRELAKMTTGLAKQTAELPVRLARLGCLGAGRVTGTVPPGERGRWTVKRFTVTPEQERFERLRATVSSSSRGRWCSAGTYTALKRGDETVMSDTPDELLDLADFYREARGRVLINGLGLGCALRMALAKPEVIHVDVVEVDADVIALVAPTFADDERLRVHEGDAYTFRFPPGIRWDVVWHDIWDAITTENDFATLHRRYGGRCGWEGSWCREQAIAADRLWQRENRWWLKR